ncbi:MAG: hypothetical protein GX264_03660 [Clostridiales bacterium]|jgi:hypothetical protein|nr:hypothetical protein [Clostridiales bacterium]
MKLKASVKTVFPDALLIIFAIASLIILPIRTFQLIKLVDPKTGFFTDGSNPTVIILYTVIVLVALIMLGASYASANIPASVPPSGKKRPLGIVSAVFAVSFLIDAIVQITSVVVMLGDKTEVALPTLTAQNAWFPLVFQALFALVSTVYFFAVAISYITGKTSYTNNRLMALAPLLWAFCRMIFRFMRAISFVKVSELLLELFAIALLIVFFMAFARISSDVNRKGTMWIIFGAGLSSAMLLLCISVPRIILVLTGNSEMLVNHSPLEYADFPAALFILTYILTILRSGYKTEGEYEAEQAEKKENAEAAVEAVEEETSETVTETAEAEEAPEITSEQENIEEKEPEKEEPAKEEPEKIPFDVKNLIDDLKD